MFRISTHEVYTMIGNATVAMGLVCLVAPGGNT